MNQTLTNFLAMPAAKRRLAIVNLCEQSLRLWESNYPADRCLTYHESVTGSLQLLDVGLPRAAFQAILEGSDKSEIQKKYSEPIAALQDLDLEFPAPLSFAYYAIYNAFQRYVVGADVEEKLILNQALSAMPEDGRNDAFKEAIENAG